MLFTHDTEVALTAAAALVNTTGDDDLLADTQALAEFVRVWGWTGRQDRSRAELDAVRSLRRRLRELWERDEDGVARLVNELLHDAHALPQLVKHDSWDYHIHATSRDAPLAERMAVEAAMAFADLVRAKELDRLRTCTYPGCGNVVVDLSKNRSKRYCDDGCANKAAVEAYRKRQRATGPS
jgi:predicted RNA-binding Zn ribbon-like protein